MCKDHNTIDIAIQGDRRATEQLLLEHYERLESRISAQIPKSLRPLVQVQDVLQDTFVHAIRSMPQCRATSPESFAVWLQAIANHRLLDTIRHLKCQKRGGRLVRQSKGNFSSSFIEPANWCGSDSTPGRKAVQHEVIRRMNSAIDDLPFDQRDAIRLRYFQGESLNETARIIDRSPAAVRGLLHRAKQRLRQIMQSSSRWLDKK